MALDAIATFVGRALASLYALYGILLALGCIFGVHYAVLLLLRPWRANIWAASRPWQRVVRWLLEFGYGFVNPLLYLVVLSANAPAWQKVPAVRAFLTWLAWTSLFGLWGYRLLMRRRVTLPPWARRLVKTLLTLTSFTIAAHG